MSVVERSAGPSRCGRPQEPSKRVYSEFGIQVIVGETVETYLINIEFRFAKTTCGDVAGWIRHLLDAALGRGKCVNESSQRVVFSMCIYIDQDFEDE
jgi:hypothetical protein